jgi:hypothetical protein
VCQGPRSILFGGEIVAIVNFVITAMILVCVDLIYQRKGVDFYYSTVILPCGYYLLSSVTYLDGQLHTFTSEFVETTHINNLYIRFLIHCVVWFVYCAIVMI